MLTADVAARSLFRQIVVNKKDRVFQRILWRKNPDEPIQNFELNTVTYDTACAPLVMRCLRQVAQENNKDLPQASNAILKDCYMDDVLTGET